MAAPTPATILTNLKTAYNNIVSGETASYSINGRTWSALNLSELSSEIDKWQAVVNRQSTSMFAVGKFNRYR